MGAFLDKPKLDKHIESDSGNGIKFGLCSMQGWRTEMEDDHSIQLSLPDSLSAWSYFAVFDGHAGSKVSELCAARLLDKILKTPEFVKLQADNSDHDNEELIRKGIVDGFLALDSELAELDEKSGSTAIVSFVTPTHIILANCGDSRAMIVNHGRCPIATEDHKPMNTSEKKRIEDAGGSVILARINGALAVSRSLGDFEYKQNKKVGATQQLVSPEPEVKFYRRQRELDKLLVLACDGIWDVYDNESLAEYLIHRLKCNEDPAVVSSELLDTCLYKGSRDNMSVLIVALDNAPKLDPQVAMQDQQLEFEIRSCVEAILNSSTEEDSKTIAILCDEVQKLNLPNYPPGGFETKRSIVENMVNTFRGKSDQ